MTHARRNSFVASLLFAASLHGAGAVILTWHIADPMVLPATARACEVEVVLKEEGVMDGGSGSTLARLQEWTPSPLLIEPRGDGLPDVEPSVSMIRRRVPECMVVPFSNLSAGSDLSEGGSAVALSGTESDWREALQTGSRGVASASAGVEAFPSPGLSKLSNGMGPTATNGMDCSESFGRMGESGLVPGRSVRPRYPASARMRGEEGVVGVTVETDDQGRARQVTVTSPSGFSSLDQAAVDAVQRVRFVSAAAGVPSRGKVSLSFRFRLVD